MRAPWGALHAGLQQLVRSVKAASLFEEMKRRDSLLARFPDPASLQAHLTDRDRALDDKNRVYESLVRIVQSRRSEGELAMALLWLGLWPGLDAMFRRRVRSFTAVSRLRGATREDIAAQLASEIAECFAARIDSFDLASIPCVAVSLLWGTDRDLVRHQEARRRLESLHVELPDDGDLLQAGTADSDVSDLGMVRGHAADEELAAIRKWLVEIVGRDAELVIAVLINGESQREAGARLSLNHEVARKRFQAAMARLRKQFHRV